MADDKIHFPRKIPILSPEVEKETKNGIYKIDLPKLKNSELVLDDKALCKTIQLRCQSLYVKHPDTICKCNSVVKTVVGGGSGDQCEIVECGKCRTAYIIRTKYDEEGHMHLNVSVWDTSRNLKAFSFRKFDDDYNFLVEFNKDNKQ